MSAKHTPGPWFSQYDDNGFYGIGSDVVSLRLAFTHGEGDTDAANARRIVACVNACEGVPTEVLEANRSGGLPWSVPEQLEELAVRKALLEALKEILAMTDEDTGTFRKRGGTYRGLVGIVANAAIAKAEAAQ